MSCAHVPMRSAALAYPDTATTMKQTSATVEYRASTDARRSLSSVGLSSTSVRRPPSHAATKTRWRPSAVIASGLSGDETVVIDGQLLLTEGARTVERGRGGQSPPAPNLTSQRGSAG